MADEHNTKRSGASRDVEAYIAALPDDIREALEQPRMVIRAVVPDATEVISYGIPTFKYHGRPLVGYGSGARTAQQAAAKRHISFYLMSTTVIDKFRADLQDYHTGKGTIHIPVGKPLPDDLIVRLVTARIEENEAKTKT